MRNLLLVAYSNVRKNITQTITFLMAAVLSGLMFNMGLLLAFSFENFFDERSRELDASHFLAIVEESVYSQAQVDFLNNYPGVVKVESEPAFFLSANITFNDTEVLNYLLISNFNYERSISDVSLFEGKEPQAANEICLPYVFKTGGYELNGQFTIEMPSQSHIYTICGFSEEIMLGTIYNTSFQFYLSEQGFAELSASGLPNFFILKAQLADPNSSTTLNRDFNKEFIYSSFVENNQLLRMYSIDWSIAKHSHTYMSGVTSIILIIFEVLLTIVCMVVVRFKIVNSIDEYMSNIGSLMAIGFTGRQILVSTVCMFSVFTFIGVTIGAGLSYLALPLVSNILEQQTALQWHQTFDLLSFLITIVGVTSIVFLVSWYSGKKMLKITPLVALRSGLSTHSHRKTSFSLERSRSPLIWMIAVKNMLRSKRQLLLVYVIVALLSFSAVSGLSVYDNLVMRSYSVYTILFGELPDASFFATSPQNAEELKSTLDANEHVESVIYSQDTNVMLNDTRVLNRVVENFDYPVGALLFEGRYPKHDNEICIGGYLAEQIGLEIGDTATVGRGGKSYNYLIVGLMQTVNNYGLACAMTTQAYLHIQENYLPHQLFVYLHDADNTEVFIDTLKSEQGTLLATAVNHKETMEAQLQTFSQIFSWVSLVVVAGTIFLVLLMLYLMLNTLILRNWQELGIQKVLGFTSIQLMNQLVLYSMPTMALGVISGAIAGSIWFGPLFVMVARSLGVVTATITISPLIIVFASLLFLVLTYVFAFIITLRIRKISAYSLITE